MPSLRTVKVPALHAFRVGSGSRSGLKRKLGRRGGARGRVRLTCTFCGRRRPRASRDTAAHRNRQNKLPVALPLENIVDAPLEDRADIAPACRPEFRLLCTKISVLWYCFLTEMVNRVAFLKFSSTQHWSDSAIFDKRGLYREDVGADGCETIVARRRYGLPPMDVLFWPMGASERSIVSGQTPQI